jgi:cytoskeletal protein RodZ
MLTAKVNFNFGGNLMSNEFQSGARSSYRAKRKKTNLILNSLIVLVLALIVFVAYSIFSSGDEKASSEKNEPKTEETKTSEEEKQADEEKQQTEEEKAVETDSGEESVEASVPESADEAQAVVTEGDGSSNVLKTIENPTWKPVGTSQSGDHVPVYNLESIDWQEMLTAISYATGLDQNSMQVYWLGSDKTQPNSSIGTVYTNDKSQIYRVYIKWVDGAGWMPTRVEELAELQK